MSKQSASKRATNLRPVDETPAADPKPKRARKARTTVSYADQIRELTAKHRAKLGSLVDAEAKLESQLAEVRRQREAAEGPLRDVEALLANHPALPIEQPAPLEQPEASEASPPAHVDGEGLVSP